MRLAAAIDEVIQAALDEPRIVGTVVMVAHKGRTVYARAAGLADREANTPTYLDTLFRFASLTKPMVSTVALRMIADGLVSLDDAVTRWLPDFQPKLADGSTPTILIRHLLTHTSGLGYGFILKPDSDYHREGVSDGLDASGLSLAENVRRIGRTTLFSEPGTQWRYSVSTDVLGHVLEQVSGKDLKQLVTEYITQPLNMPDTVFYVPPEKATRLATAYADGKPAPVRMSDVHSVPFRELGQVVYAPTRAFDPQAFPGGGSGMSGTAPDFLRFLETMRQGGGAILNPEATQSLMTNQIGSTLVNFMGPGWGFGFGGAVLTDPELAKSELSVGSFRWGGAYGNTWFIDPVRELSVVALTNTALEGTGGVFPQQLQLAICRAIA